MKTNQHFNCTVMRRDLELCVTFKPRKCQLQTITVGKEMIRPWMLSSYWLLACAPSNADIYTRVYGIGASIARQVKSTESPTYLFSLKTPNHFVTFNANCAKYVTGESPPQPSPPTRPLSLPLFRNRSLNKEHTQAVDYR